MRASKAYSILTIAISISLSVCSAMTVLAEGHPNTCPDYLVYGQWGSDGSWQARNTHAILESPLQGGTGFEQSLLTGWGEDIRLTYTHDETCYLFHPKLATSDGIVYNVLFSDASCGLKLHLVQSYDSGVTWGEMEDFLPPNGYNGSSISAAVAGNYTYYVFHAGLTYRGIYMRRSSNSGRNWMPIQFIDTHINGAGSVSGCERQHGVCGFGTRRNSLWKAKC